MLDIKTRTICIGPLAAILAVMTVLLVEVALKHLSPEFGGFGIGPWCAFGTSATIVYIFLLHRRFGR